MRWIDWFFDLFCVYVPVPAVPSFTVTFSRAPGDPMSLIGTVAPKPDNSPVPIAQRIVTVALDGGTPVTLDATAGAVTFTVEDGQTCVIDMESVSVGGVHSLKTTLTIVAHDSVTPPNPPQFDVSFAPAQPSPPAS